MTHHAAGWLCVAVLFALSARILVGDVWRARRKITAALSALFPPAASVAAPATATPQPAAVEARRRPASKVA